VRRRFLRSIISVTALAVVLFGVPLGVVASQLYRGREVNRLERQATLAAGSLPKAPIIGDPIDLPPGPANMQRALYDKAGRRVVGEGPARGDTVVLGALRGEVVDDHDGRWLAVAVPVHDEEKIVGAARAAFPWEKVDEATERSWLLMGALGAAAIALAGAIAAWQSARLIGPVRDVALRATALGQGDFATRLAPSGVPELDHAAEALNRTAARLGELLARERAFAADVSHQLSTPLTSLRLELESALLTPNADLGASVERAVGEVERLQATIAALLNVARDDPAADATSDVATVCRAIAARHAGPLAAVGRLLRLDLDDGLPRVRCPADVLAEILTVLLQNAQDHGAGVVTLAARPSGTGAIVDVSDDGPGIAGDADVVFQRRSRDAAGHGIGLALARSLAEAYGARLQLTRSGPRPTFTIALPGAATTSA
jgi:signal transduction histidine kinase